MKIRVSSKWNIGKDKILFHSKVDEYYISGNFLVIKYEEDGSKITKIIELASVATIDERK